MAQIMRYQEPIAFNRLTTKQKLRLTVFNDQRVIDEYQEAHPDNAANLARRITYGVELAKWATASLAYVYDGMQIAQGDREEIKQTMDTLFRSIAQGVTTAISTYICPGMEYVPEDNWED